VWLCGSESETKVKLKDPLSNAGCSRAGVVESFDFMLKDR
jgi:hypothetical protein